MVTCIECIQNGKLWVFKLIVKNQLDPLDLFVIMNATFINEIPCLNNIIIEARYFLKSGPNFGIRYENECT